MVPLPALTPATPEAVREAEAVIGYKLPRLLRRLYLEVGNGGFGPGYGVLGLSGGHRVGGQTALDLYRQATPTSSWSFLPTGLLPLCPWDARSTHSPTARTPMAECGPGIQMEDGVAGKRCSIRRSNSATGWIGGWQASSTSRPRSKTP